MTFIRSPHRQSESCFVESLPRISYLWDINPQYIQQRPHLLHKHRDLVELYLVVRGTLEITIDAVRYSVREGDLILINAGVLHDEYSDTFSDDLHICAFALEHVSLRGLSPHQIIPAGAIPVIASDQQFDNLRSMMLTLFSLAGSGSSLSSETCTLLTASLVSILFDLTAELPPQTLPASRASQLTRNVCEFIESSFSQAITLQSISQSLNISPSYLSHTFKDITGCSPMQYVMRRRIGEAQTMLVMTDDPITQISGSVGYDNSSHFSAIFSKYIGMSPGKYRKLHNPLRTE